MYGAAKLKKKKRRAKLSTVARQTFPVHILRSYGPRVDILRGPHKEYASLKLLYSFARIHERTPAGRGLLIWTEINKARNLRVVFMLTVEPTIGYAKPD